MYKYLIISCFLLSVAGLQSASAVSFVTALPGADLSNEVESVGNKIKKKAVEKKEAPNALKGTTGKELLAEFMVEFNQDFDKKEYRDTLKIAKDKKAKLKSNIRKTNIATVVTGAIVAAYSTTADVVVGGGIITLAIGAYKTWFQEEVDDKDMISKIESCEALVGAGKDVRLSYNSKWNSVFTRYGDNIVSQPEVEHFTQHTAEITARITQLSSKCI